MHEGHIRLCLILWDIDHTLIETRGIGSTFSRTAFHEITGQPMRTTPAITGKTEAAIIAEALRLHGLTPSDDDRHRYAQALAAQYTRHADQLRQQGRALPGAHDALAALAQRPDAVQSVLTGNFRQVAITKLEVFNLSRYVDVDAGAYGDNLEDRAALVPIAQHRAAAKYGQPFTKADTVIIGDSTHDIHAAHHGGATAIAVATGTQTADDLHAAGPVAVLPDLTNTDQVIEAITNATR